MMRQASASFSSNNVEIFWGKYIENLRKQRVKDSAQRWLVMRAEDFIRAARGRKLLDHSAEDVNHYLEEQGRKAGLQGWQFLQIVDAIRILLETANIKRGSGLEKSLLGCVPRFNKTDFLSKKNGALSVVKAPR